MIIEPPPIDYPSQKTRPAASIHHIVPRLASQIMIKVVVGLVTDLKYINEDGEECEKWVYLKLESPIVPMPGPLSLLLPSPGEFVWEPIEARIEYVKIVGAMVYVRATADNLVIDEDAVQALLKIGYSEEPPEEYLQMKLALMIRS